MCVRLLFSPIGKDSRVWRKQNDDKIKTRGGLEKNENDCDVWKEFLFRVRDTKKQKGGGGGQHAKVFFFFQVGIVSFLYTRWKSSDFDDDDDNEVENIFFFIIIILLTVCV